MDATLKSLDALGQDAIVDAGRLGLAGVSEPLMYAADLCQLATRTDLVALSGPRLGAHPARRVRAAWRRLSGGAARGGEGPPYRAREKTKVLDLPVLASLPSDDAGLKTNVS